MDFCNRLYAVERKAEGLPPGAKPPGTGCCFVWLEKQKTRVLPKSLSGAAITCCLNQWGRLKAYLLDGRLEIDNNRSERAIVFRQAKIPKKIVHFSPSSSWGIFTVLS
ncbi:transposase [Paenibacillus sp. JMULE4]|uniref:IS66 family transposase n=1 Tax=Paenibacillus sp. JMULE4 TaxID=2518342 RepID=UPI0035C85B8D